jgi:hypothetical protein
MAQELIANAQPTRLLALGQIWLTALIRPSMSRYAAFGQQPRVSAWRAYSWVFAAGLVGGAIDALAPFVGQQANRRYVDALLFALIPVSSIIAVCYLAAFAWCAQRIAYLFKGSGTYPQLAYVFASFSAPMLIATSILDVIPLTRSLLVALYIYWLALYVVAVRAVNGFSRLKAMLIVLLAFLILGSAWLGVAFVVGYSGLLLP